MVHQTCGALIIEFPDNDPEVRESCDFGPVWSVSVKPKLRVRGGVKHKATVRAHTVPGVLLRA